MAVVPIVVPVIVRHQKRIVAALRDAGATNPARAVALESLAVHDGQALAILRRHEIVRDVGDQRLWFDQAAWEEHEARRTRLAISIAIVAATLVGTGLLVLWMSNH